MSLFPLIEPKVCIVLLNFEGATDTIACLESLGNISYQNHNVVVVDNASSDDSLHTINKYLREKHSNTYGYFESPELAIKENALENRYTLIKSNKNGGYGSGNNIGIRYALKILNTNYVLILNNDTVVDSNFLEPLVSACESDHKIGIASGKIFFMNRPNTIWFNGGKFYPCTSKVKHLDFGRQDTGQYPPQYCNFLSGCMWLVPVRVFNTVGLINEEYFMYVEDLEFSQRVIKSGYRLGVSGASKIWHKAGGSTGGHLSPFSTYYIARNSLKFIWHDAPGHCKIVSLFYLIVVKSVRWLYKKEFTLLVQHLKGLLDAIKR
jgi:GT2 family glycosyltransferase